MGNSRTPQKDRSMEGLERVLEEADHDIEDILDDFNDEDDGDRLVKTPASGRLTLNPKVDRNARIPLCPNCREEIQRVETPNELVEFRCGCDELQYFEFPERESE